jgi:hypothetical protein
MNGKCNKNRIDLEYKTEWKMSLEPKNENGSEVLTFAAVMCSALSIFVVTGFVNLNKQ